MTGGSSASLTARRNNSQVGDPFFLGVSSGGGGSAMPTPRLPSDPIPNMMFAGTGSGEGLGFGPASPPPTHRSYSSSSNPADMMGNLTSRRTAPSAYDAHGNDRMVAKLQCPPGCVCHNRPSVAETTQDPTHNPPELAHLKSSPQPPPPQHPDDVLITITTPDPVSGEAAGGGIRVSPSSQPSSVLPESELLRLAAASAATQLGSLAESTSPEEWRKAYRLRLLQAVFSPDPPTSCTTASSSERPRFICHVASGKEFGFPHDYFSEEWDKAYDQRTWEAYRRRKEEERGIEQRKVEERRVKWRAKFQEKLCSNWRFRIKCKDTNALRHVRDCFLSQGFPDSLGAPGGPEKSMTSPTTPSPCPPDAANPPPKLFSKAAPPTPMAATPNTSTANKVVYLGSATLPAPPPTTKAKAIQQKLAGETPVAAAEPSKPPSPKKKHMVARAFASFGKTLTGAGRNTVVPAATPTGSAPTPSSGRPQKTAKSPQKSQKKDPLADAYADSPSPTPSSQQQRPVQAEHTYRELDAFEARLKNGQENGFYPHRRRK